MKHTTPTRRELIAAGAAAVALAPLGASAATPFDAAVRAVVGEATPVPGRVRLDIPQLTENGNSVSITVAVESPLTATDHVKAIHVFAEKNPYPDVARFHLGPRAGKAEVSTTIRLATSQRVLVVAAMSDGSFVSDEKNVVVTLGACVDGG